MVRTRIPVLLEEWNVFSVSFKDMSKYVLFFVNMCVRESLRVPCACRSPQARRSANSLELVLAGSCKLSDAALGTELQSSARTVNLLTTEPSL